MSHWTDAGFGTDPEGDARRRDELEAARLDEVDLAAAVRRTAHLVPPSPAEVETVLGAEVVEQLDPHAIDRVEYPWGVAWRCACGGWEAVATGPSSAAWAGADHARHVRSCP